MLNRIYSTYKERRLLHNHSISLRLTAREFRVSVAFVKLVVTYYTNPDFNYLNELVKKNTLYPESAYLILKIVDKRRSDTLRQITDFIVINGYGIRTRQILNKLDKAIAQKEQDSFSDEFASDLISEVINDCEASLAANLTPYRDYLRKSLPLL